MASTDTILALYSAAGLLELSGVAVTAVDLRHKAQAARDWTATAPAKSVIDEYLANNAAAEGLMTYAEGKRMKQPLLTALRGPWLGIAACLLAAGIIVGTVANALSATT